MPFGTTYAAYATAIVLSVLAPVPEWARPDQPLLDDQIVYSFGMNAPDKAGIGKDGMYAVELWKSKDVYPGIRPMYSVAWDGKTGGYASFTLRKDFHLGKFQISPYGGVALYQSDWTNYNAEDLIQYRTGFDVSLKLGQTTKLTAGFYHISNLSKTGSPEGSADMDVTRIAFVSRF